MFAKLQQAAYFLIFLKSHIFETKVFLEIQKQYFKILVMQMRWEQSGFLPSPSCSFQHALLSVSITLYFAKMVTFLVWSRVCCAVLCCAVLCCAVLNKLSTLFDFAVHCKTQDFNISLDKLLFIQVFKGNL